MSRDDMLSSDEATHHPQAVPHSGVFKSTAHLLVGLSSYMHLREIESQHFGLNLLFLRT